jgi:hypothetical protein
MKKEGKPKVKEEKKEIVKKVERPKTAAAP